MTFTRIFCERCLVCFGLATWCPGYEGVWLDSSFGKQRDTIDGLCFS